jgi:orotidine-5'-phosphate decarboxylase
MMTFIEKLRGAQVLNDSWLCIGLDPSADLMPPGVDVLTFCKRIIDVTSDYACAYKPNLAFYLHYGADGIQALQETIAHVPKEIPVVLDANFGNVGYTASHNASAAFETFGVDAVTITPYVGMDAVVPFLAYPGKMAFVVVRSSNTTGNDFQCWPSTSAPLFRFVTAQLNTLADDYPNQVGIGVAATQPRDLGQIRSWAPTLPFLIPGLGMQGGDLDLAIEQGMTRDGIGPLISVTRSIIYASAGSDYAEAARSATSDWANHIREAREARQSQYKA